MAQTQPPRLSVLALGFLAAGLGGPGVASAQNGALATTTIFEALALRPGAAVCEMGAGNGELSIEAADRVGGQGHVYANEIGGHVKTLQDKVAAAKRPQIEVVTGANERTNFPDGACDALFMRNVYHHVENPTAMNASIAAALKAGGRLGVVDFGPPPGAEAAKPADRDEDGRHGVTPQTVARELKAAGFDVIATTTGSGRAFMVVALKRGS
jgi:ubiquinone/menaquinone biosynthesis C-methylase UbiE